MLEDLDFVLEVRNNDTTRRFLRDNRVFNKIDAIKWFQKRRPQWLIILDAQNNEKLGYFRIEGDMVGCDIHPDHRRRGIARKAYENYLENIEKATLWVFEENFAIDLYCSLGFVKTGKEQVFRGMKEIEMLYERGAT